MELGKLAANKADNQGVKDFGNTLATDHGQAKEEAAAVARQMHAKVPDSMKREARREERKLQGMSGAAFDKEFVSFMIKDHKKDISEFERQAKSRDKAPAELAKKQLPTLQKHLEMAQSLQSKE